MKSYFVKNSSVNMKDNWLRVKAFEKATITSENYKDCGCIEWHDVTLLCQKHAEENQKHAEENKQNDKK